VSDGKPDEGLSPGVVCRPRTRGQSGFHLARERERGEDGRIHEMAARKAKRMVKTTAGPTVGM
jgi:hypothetical protein